ncbi:MAG: EAL domain-containing protein [Treponema sp.]|nr:EAL domain-containing protein [Treponema sp.]
MKKTIVRRRKITLFVLIAFLCVVTVFAAVFRCAILIKQNYVVQLEQNLADVSEQNADALKEQIQIRFNLLKSVAMRFNIEPENRKENLYMFEPVADAFHLKRIGFCDEKGMTYATSGNITDLSHRDFFIRSMKGDFCISLVDSDAMDDSGEPLTIMTMPIYDKENQINGIAGITYTTESLSQELAIKFFNGMGNTFILNEAGTVVISSDENIAATNKNMFDLLWKESAVMKDFSPRKDFLDSKFKDYDKGDNKFSTIYLNGVEYYFHVTSVKVMENNAEWWVLSMVPDVFIQDRFATTRRNLVRMIIIVFVFGIFAVLALRQISIKRRKLSYSYAFTSLMTGGPNLNYMTLVLNRNDVVSGFVVVMNINNFIHISLAIGKSKSEDIIKKIWEILSESETNDDFFCHNKSDSFIMYYGAKDEMELKGRLLDLDREIQDEAAKLHLAWIKPVFGVYQFTRKELLEYAYRKAELALQDAVEKKAFYAFYDDAEQKNQLEIQEKEEHFKDALLFDEFIIYFQPKFSTINKELTGCEALVRWNFRGKEMLSPDKFIPILENNGRINRLDEYVFNRVCEYQSKWKKQGLPLVPVSVNLSKASLFRSEIVERYCAKIKKAGLNMSDIQIEVTETMVSSGANISELLNKFRNHGIKILMDDFGTGFTALSTLNLQCFDTLKMDKSLVDGIEEDFGRRLLSSIIEMSQKLGYYITAEGVENENQYEFLKSTECNDIQGFYFSRPVPAEEFEKILQLQNVKY